MTVPKKEAPPTGFLLHHDAEGFLDALKLLIDSKKVQTADNLVRYAEKAKETNAAEFLRTMAAESLPVNLMYDALSVHIRIVAHKRNNRLLQECQQKTVGLVMPLPRHVLDAFIDLPKVTVLVPDGHRLPVGLRGRTIDERKGSRTSRNAAPNFDVLVFEAQRDGTDYYIDPAVSDVVDLRLIPSTTQLLVHLRPHLYPEDLPLATGSHTLNHL